MSTNLIDRITSLVQSGEASRSGLARAAGLHPNSLRKLGAPDWNPTADTLGRLEKLLDGVSLTVNEVEDQGETTRFTVNIIPHTLAHTTLGDIATGRALNVEIDVLARYLQRMTAARV
jgi:ribosome-binding protein aMBF1 (putative translation factor)